MKRIRRTPRGNRCDKSLDSQGILLFVLKRGKIAISRQPLFNMETFPNYIISILYGVEAFADDLAGVGDQQEGVGRIFLNVIPKPYRFQPV